MDRRFLGLVCGLALAGCNRTYYKNPLQQGVCSLNFEEHVRPVLTRYCAGCHAPEELAGQGEAVVRRLLTGSMPPPGSPRPPDGDVALIRQWVEAGMAVTRAAAEANCGGCDRRVPPPAPLARLTKYQYRNSLRDLLGQGALDAAADSLASLPDDKPAEGFDSMSGAVHSAHVVAYYAAGDTVGAYFAAQADRRGALSPCLGGPAPDRESCVRPFVSSLGSRAYRRPLSDEESGELLSLYDAGGGPAEGVGMVVSALLQSADFLYRVEVRGEPVEGEPGLYALTPFETATRLSYLAWGSLPDEALFRAAAEGTLDVAREAERLFSDPRARENGAHFYRQWLHFDRVPAFEQSADFLAGLPTGGLAEQMSAEAQAFLDYVTWDVDGTFSDLMAARTAFVPGAELAALYGVAPAPRTELPPSRRAGILTRAALLADSGNHTAPLRRGAFIRRQILCDPLPDPDPGALPPGATQPPELDPHRSTRERWEAKTSDAVCATCHGLINPLGFAFESFDSIGRARDRERVFDSFGSFVRELPIDTVVSPNVDATGDAPVDGPVELSQRLAQSEKARLCFATQWFRYSAGRREAQGDRCQTRDLQGVLRERGIRAMLGGFATLPEFRLRNGGVP